MSSAFISKKKKNYLIKLRETMQSIDFIDDINLLTYLQKTQKAC